MKKKIDELINQQPKDVNSLESQAFLKEIHERSLERQTKMKKMIEEWKEEDRQNENK